MRVVLVGICGSGKSTLAQELIRLGYEVKECRQEHSGVPYMWQVLSRPDVLIYLDASEEEVTRRGRHFYVSGIVDEQRKRLAHARAHCDLYLHTDDLNAAQVLERVSAFLAVFKPAQK
jgi:UDP-N-acetylmuramate-alanine ligase